jgi:hypothetical protein
MGLALKLQLITLNSIQLKHATTTTGKAARGLPLALG